MWQLWKRGVSRLNRGLRRLFPLKPQHLQLPISLLGLSETLQHNASLQRMACSNENWSDENSREQSSHPPPAQITERVDHDLIPSAAAENLRFNLLSFSRYHIIKTASPALKGKLSNEIGLFNVLQ
jgi:hypothetical protein